MEDSLLYSLAKKYKTPLYAYDGDMIIENYKSLKESLDENVDIFYSLKTNPNLGIANLFNELDSGVEVASMGEISVAMKAGFSPNNIVFSGPGKTRKELEFAISQNIYCIIAESLDEIKIIDEISDEYGYRRKINIGLRINPAFKNFNNSLIKMGGIPSQFGVEEQEIDQCINFILNSSNLNFLGIHVYSGTQILDYEEVIKSMEYTLNLSEKIMEQYKIKFEMIDLGGGFGVPYFPHESDFNIEGFVKKINDLINIHKSKYGDIRYIIESGRFLVANFGYYITQVNYIKKSRNQKFIVTDGGLNHHQGATFRGRLMKNNYPIKVLSDREKNKEEEVYLVGPLCTPEDCTGRNVRLSELQVGDFICIEKSGAYGLTYSPILFLSHDTPIELLILQNTEQIIRNRMDINKVLEYQSLLFERGVKQ